MKGFCSSSLRETAMRATFLVEKIIPVDAGCHGSQCYLFSSFHAKDKVKSGHSTREMKEASLGIQIIEEGFCFFLIR